MRVNGEEIQLTEPAVLLHFLQARGYDPKRVAVEKNGAIVPRAEFAATLLQTGDVLEILRFVGGG